MADKEVIEMLKDLKKGQDELFRGQNELFKGQNERDNILNELKKGQEELFKGQKQLFEGQEELISRVDKIEENQQEMKTEMTKIEVEHGEKLEILLDVVTGHTKQINSIKERVEKCEKRLDNHDDKFYVLNSAVQAY